MFNTYFLTRNPDKHYSLPKTPPYSLPHCNRSCHLPGNPKLVWHPACLIRDGGCEDLSMDTIHLVSGQYPPGQYPPGQYPPRTKSPRTISPRSNIPPDNIPPDFFFLNSSVLNYPKLCAGKKNSIKRKLQCFKLF